MSTGSQWSSRASDILSTNLDGARASLPAKLAQQAQWRSRFALMPARMPALRKPALALSARLANTFARSLEDESMKLFVVLLIALAVTSINVSAQTPKQEPCAEAQNQADMTKLGR